MAHPKRPRKLRRPRRAKRPDPRSAAAATSSLDLAVLRALILLSTADCLELADHQWPPKHLCRWLETADLRQVRGLLLATLERWRRLHRTPVDP